MAIRKTTTASLVLYIGLSILSPLVTGAPSAGFQQSEEIEALFKRQNGAGTNGWQNAYPSTSAVASTTNLPQAWLDRLKTVTSQPSFPTYGATNFNGGYPKYSNGKPGTDPSICSFTYQCVDSQDIYNGPNGTIGISFDDGPTAESTKLYPYLAENNITATHFMIGGNIYWNKPYFQNALDQGGHIAVHTWSHPYMTTLTNEQVLAELGYTMQIIYEGTGGKVPGFWRPPYGDVDNRVRAIASGVFGLKTVVWNQDTGDWAIGNNPQYTNQSVIAQYTQWMEGSKSPGLVVLEHEVDDSDVNVFKTMYPIMKSNGWRTVSIPEAFDLPMYQNADRTTDTATNDSILQEGTLYPNGTLSSGWQIQGDAVTMSTSSSTVSSSTASSSSSSSSTSITSSSSSVVPSSSTSASARATASSSSSNTSGAGLRTHTTLTRVVLGMLAFALLV